MSEEEPTINQLFEVLARAASGIRGARVELSPDLDLDAPLVRLGYALNILLSDLEFRHNEAENALKGLLEERTRRLRQSEDAVRLREDFLAIAAHELNSPLTSLQLLVQGFSRGMLKMSPDKVEHAVALMERQTRTLRRLVDQLLDMARFTAYGMSLQLGDTDLSVIVRDVAEQLGEQLQRAGCRLSIHVDGRIVGLWDRERLQQVTVNLLENALKFGAGKPIDVNLAEDGGIAQLTVRDYGIGIPAERLSNVFDRFERGVPVTHYGGLGLGLFIVREIVRAHGGSVRVESQLDQGTTFIVELPREG